MGNQIGSRMRTGDCLIGPCGKSSRIWTRHQRKLWRRPNGPSESKSNYLARTVGRLPVPERTLAKALDSAGRQTEARVLREQVVAACRRNRGDEDEQTLDAELWLAVSLAREGMYKGALSLATHAADGRRRIGSSEVANADGIVQAIVQAGGLAEE